MVVFGLAGLQKDRDRLKHSTVEQTLERMRLYGSCLRPAAVVYIFDDPLHAVFSLLRREFFKAQVVLSLSLFAGKEKRRRRQDVTFFSHSPPFSSGQQAAARSPSTVS